MAIVQRTKTYAVCPTCGADAGQVDHLLGQDTSTAWYCDACGHRYRLKFTKDGQVEITPMPGQKFTTYDVLKIDPQQKPVYFVVEGLDWRGEGRDEGLEERHDSKRFYYEEHSCPTNWFNPVMVYFDGDSDPHGVIEFVDTVEASAIPEDEMVSPNDHDRALVALIEKHANHGDHGADQTS